MYGPFDGIPFAGAFEGNDHTISHLTIIGESYLGLFRQWTSKGGMGKTTAEMQTGSTFLGAGWDFMDEIENGTDDIWWINEGQDYPRLYWE